MDARWAVKVSKSARDRDAELEAHRRIDEAKRSLGERGPAWWDDGAPDNRYAVKRRVVRQGQALWLIRGLENRKPLVEEGEDHDLIRSEVAYWRLNFCAILASVILTRSPDM
ncbi:hypothetical protein AB7M49_003756 [Bradyrhizobium elkanii]